MKFILLSILTVLPCASPGEVVEDFDEAEVKYNTGVDYLKAGDWANAETVLLEALDMGCNLKYNAYMGIGQARMEQALYEEAIYAFEKAEAIKGTYLVYRSLGSAYIKLGDTESFIRAMSGAAQTETLVSFDNQMYKAYIIAGDYEREISDYNDAIMYYEQACEIYRDGYLAIAGLGFAYYETEDFDNAIRILNQAITNTDATAIAYLNLGNAYLKTDEYEQALVIYESGIDLADEDLKKRFINNMSVAENSISKPGVRKGIPVTDINEAAALIKTGNELLASGDIEAALSDYGRAQELNPYAYYAWYNAGVAYLRQKNYDSSINCLVEAEAVDADNPEAFFLHARIAAVTGDNETAYEKLGVVISIDPSYVIKAENDNVFDNIFGIYGNIE